MSSILRRLINCGDISIWFDPKTEMIKSLFRLSLRMVTGFVQSLIKLCGLDWTAPNISDIRTPRFVEDKGISIL